MSKQKQKKMRTKNHWKWLLISQTAIDVDRPIEWKIILKKLCARLSHRNSFSTIYYLFECRDIATENYQNQNYFAKVEQNMRQTFQMAVAFLLATQRKCAERSCEGRDREFRCHMFAYSIQFEQKSFCEICRYLALSMGLCLVPAWWLS